MSPKPQKTGGEGENTYYKSNMSQSPKQMTSSGNMYLKKGPNTLGGTMKIPQGTTIPSSGSGMLNSRPGYSSKMGTTGSHHPTNSTNASA